MVHFLHMVIETGKKEGAKEMIQLVLLLFLLALMIPAFLCCSLGGWYLFFGILALFGWFLLFCFVLQELLDCLQGKDEEESP